MANYYNVTISNSSLFNFFAFAFILFLSDLFEEDIVMDVRLRDWVSGKMQKRDAVTLEKYLWKDGILPYVISDDIGNAKIIFKII